MSHVCRWCRLLQQTDTYRKTAMTTAAELSVLRDRIARILTTDPCQRVSFNVPGFSLRPGGFFVIGTSLAFSDAAHRPAGHRGRPMHVRVEHMPPNVGAMYYARSNSIVVPRANYGLRDVERETIVHEATHAIFDFQRVRLPAWEEEATAYIADAVYRRICGNTEAGATGIDAIADSIAQDISATTRGLAPWTHDVTAAQMQRLITAIRADAAYAGLRTERRGYRYLHNGGTL